ncbi:plasmid replication initiator RepA [Morganella psychrotolerans]|uniref:plasmid replication initiator RepA n=1 Tax=Morganella psychrotolerans TaxID=368603 RepID=UPI0039B0ABF0
MADLSIASHVSNLSTQANRRRSYVSNPVPAYNSPNMAAKKPAIVKALTKAAASCNPARHEAWYTTPRVLQKSGTARLFRKRMNEHRARAINALMVAMTDRLNIVSGKIEASVEQLSDWCGLSTQVDGSVKSISRCSRAIMTLEELGALACERVWDEASRSHIPKLIWVTELFFVLIGYDLGRFQAAQSQQLAWVNQGLLKQGDKPITLTEARRRAKEQHIRRAFEVRARNRNFKYQKKQALKLMQQDQQVAKTEILRGLVKMFSAFELESMGYKELQRQVDQRYFTLRKLAGTEPPDQ